MTDRSAAAAPPIAIVLSGGVGLGAYQAGAYSALHERGLHPRWVAGSSIGAVNAAIIAGNGPQERLDRLREFWKGSDLVPIQAEGFACGEGVRHLQNWMSAVRARLFGVPGLFHPRVASFERFSGLYDLTPLRRRLDELVNFDRLNSGDTRISIATTDIESGDTVVFDTARGARIGVEHVMASCGFVPEFAPVEIGGRMLGDGGLSANAPLEAVLAPGDDNPDLDSETVCFVVDLFARDGARPANLESALQRKNDLLFGNQTFQRLEAYVREEKLLARLDRLVSTLSSDQLIEMRNVLPALRRNRIKSIFYLSYRATVEEAGPEKTFDLSRRILASRWRSGELDMEAALVRFSEQPRPPLSVIRRHEEAAA
jgi:NTE family protein